jgi:hypothetical protein
MLNVDFLVEFHGNTLDGNQFDFEGSRLDAPNLFVLGSFK